MQKPLSDKQLEFLLSLDTEKEWEEDLISLPGLILEFYPNQVRKSTKSLQKLVDSCRGYVKTDYINLSLHMKRRDINRQYLVLSLTAKGQKAIQPIKEQKELEQKRKREESDRRMSNQLDSAARMDYGKPYSKLTKRQKDEIIKDLAGWTG